MVQIFVDLILDLQSVIENNRLYGTIRSLHSLSTRSYPSKTNRVFSASFFPSTTKLWNSLSYDAVTFCLLKSVPNLNVPNLFFVL